MYLYLYLYFYYMYQWALEPVIWANHGVPFCLRFAICFVLFTKLYFTEQSSNWFAPIKNNDLPVDVEIRKCAQQLHAHNNLPVKILNQKGLSPSPRNAQNRQEMNPEEKEVQKGKRQNQGLNSVLLRNTIRKRWRVCTVPIYVRYMQACCDLSPMCNVYICTIIVCVCGYEQKNVNPALLRK